MSNRGTSVSRAPISIDLGENPVNNYQARIYAQESSPSSVAVCLELTENARDNGTEVTLTIEVAGHSVKDGITYLIPERIICEDNGTGLSHKEFLQRFCGAFSDSDVHRETDRAGRNGVGTKTYTSIAERILVTTTTARATEGLSEHIGLIPQGLRTAIQMPVDGESDTLWRAYEFKLHSRSMNPTSWTKANALEMGTRVELVDIIEGTEIPFDILLERLSYAREWLQNSANSFTLQITGSVPQGLPSSRKVVLKSWNPPTVNWLVEASGSSDKPLTIFDPTTNKSETIAACKDLHEPIQFDFRVVGRANDGSMKNLEKPALLLEICGALPYPPNLEGGQSARTLPLLTFMGLEHASSIGAFCNAVCGYGRINSLALKEALRNNKSTLASGPGTEQVTALRTYLQTVFRLLHRVWYNATRSSQEEAAKEAISEAEVEVNFALKGVNRNAFRTGDITHTSTGKKEKAEAPPVRRHRWECGACERRWLADAGFTPEFCAQVCAGGEKAEGCGSENIGLAKNQPRVGDCRILIEQLGDPKIPSTFQFEREGEDLELPVVRVNLTSPRYVELRGGTGRLSGQSQQRLKQFLVDISLAAIAEFNAETKQTSFSEEFGELYYNRMLRYVGIRKFEAEVSKVIESVGSREEQTALALS